MTEYEKLVLAKKFIDSVKANDKQLSSAIQMSSSIHAGVQSPSAVHTDTPDIPAVPASDLVGDVAIVEPATGLTGVAITVKDMVRVYYGADDGSDDMTISVDQFNQQFRVTGFVSYWE